MRIGLSTLFLCLGVALMPTSVFSGRLGQSAISVGNVDPGDIAFKGFQLSEKTTIEISGTGGAFVRPSVKIFTGNNENWGMPLVFYGWIVDSETRAVVWHTFEDERERKRKRDIGLFDIEDSITLDAGQYELYYAGAPNHFRNSHGFISKIFTADRKKYQDRFRDRLEISISGPQSTLEEVNAKKLVDKENQKAIVSFIRQEDNEINKMSFSLSQTTTLQVYAVGEMTEHSEAVFDFAWIYDLDRRKRVWQINADNAQHAGGAEKNMMAREIIELPKGNYMVYQVTDDSHSYEYWNERPPHDPQFWGISIWADSEKDRRKVTLKEIDLPEPVLALTEARDDDFIAQGFTLERDLDLHLLCLGEGTYRSGMVDYGWIVNAATREKVWEMDIRDTLHAGGAEKNRMIDQTIQLKEGSYIAYYVTDDSHAYQRWNAGRPYSPQDWGLSLWTLEPKDAKLVTFFDERDFRSENVISEIIRVRDDELINEPFSLDQDTRIRVVALGEGTDGRMYDYGWIENSDTGKVIWEMTYRKTDHGGGAHKNRSFNEVILLAAGNYRLFYETDDSHSYGSWNASPPMDPDHYGISLLHEP